MANDFFNSSGYPATRAPGQSSPLRAQLAAIAAAFDKLPVLTGNAGKLVRVNAGGTALEATTSIDSVTIGGATPGSGTFTTLASTALATLSSLTVTGAFAANGSMTFGNAAGDALTVNSSSITWANNPTHSGNHIFSGNLTVQGNTTIGNASGDAVTIWPAAITWQNNPTHSANHTFTGTVASAGFTGPLTGNVTGNVSGSSGSTTGNAATATILQTSRTLTLNGATSGASFNGSASATIPVVGSFNINGSGPSTQNDGLYVADLGGTVGSTLNPIFTAAIMGQVAASRSVGFACDGNYVFGFRSHTSAGTYTWISRVQEADTLTTARTINGTSFDGSANITVTAAASTLTGTTLSAGVTASSLTSLGTLTSLNVSGNSTLGDALGDTLTVAGGAFKVFSDGRISGNKLHNIGTVTGTTDQFIASGTYAPTATAIQNLGAAPTIGTLQWIRVGNVATVSGYASSSPTAGATQTRFSIPFPIASALTSFQQCAGTINSASGVAAEAGTVYGDSTNDVAEFSFVSSGTGARNQYFTFTYLIQ